MKFLCDNCKAKYQIADEKVAGKTVRMKCRKCGHQIEVRAAVTETSVSTSPPLAPGAAEPAKAAAKGSLATSLSAAKPRSPSAHQSVPPGALAGAFERQVQDTPQTVPFAQAPSALELSVTDDWYVAINGVPVGPVRVSELRRKAASGAVTEDSLCWQEGLEEWRPVRSIPDLAAIVRAAAQANRPPLVGQPPSEGRASSPPRALNRTATPGRAEPSPRPRAEATAQPRVEATPGPRLATPAAASSRSNVVPLRVAATASDGEPGSAPLLATGAMAAAALAPAPFGAPTAAYAPQTQPSPAPTEIAADRFAMPPPASDLGPTGTASGLMARSVSLAAVPADAPELVPVQPPQKRGVPLWFWPILVFTGVFGVAAAVFAFGQQAPQPPVVIQSPATAATASATEPKVEVPPHPTTAASEPSAAAPTPVVKVAAGGPKSDANTAAATPEKKGLDVTGLLGGAGGPNLGAGPGRGGGGGGSLDSSSVERVVASRRAGIKRTCWERGGADQKSSVNVTISATVAPDGSVSGTSSSGDDPVVAKCIESQVRNWRFDAPGSTTTVNIPFKFVRQ